MNLILFEEHELGRNLPRRDERTIHLLKVLHKKAGDIFEAGILGKGRGTGRIEKINLDGSIIFTVEVQSPPIARIPIRVAAGFPRPIQIRRLLRDLSSLGIEAIDLFGTDLGEKSYRDTKLLIDGGALTALIEGASQSRDTTLPQLRVFTSLDNWLSECPWDSIHEGGAVSEPLLSTDTSRFRPPSAPYGHSHITLPPRRNPLSPMLIAADNVRPEGALSRMTHTKRPVVLAIGSERGWTDREREILEGNGFLRLSLGSRALRTETACVAAAVMAMAKIGELG
ncbi:MAG: 16S rRNA (uracil(1498)-N(3))-methyltransferase [Treponema sp.]|nr:16S rRNA (uracil(1498)-N(3))-methyltransferase [Treponema sp.]